MEADLLHNPKPKFHHIWDTNVKTAGKRIVSFKFKPR